MAIKVRVNTITDRAMREHVQSAVIESLAQRDEDWWVWIHEGIRAGHWILIVMGPPSFAWETAFSGVSGQTRDLVRSSLSTALSERREPSNSPLGRRIKVLRTAH